MAFQVSLVGHEGQPVPDWVLLRLQSEGITFVVRECRTRAELMQSAKEADLVWVFGGSRILWNGAVDDRLADLPKCHAIVRTGSGTDNIPVESATRLGIVVANTPEVFSESVSDHALGLLLCVSRQIALHDRKLRKGELRQRTTSPPFALDRKTLGLIGFGHIARSLVRKAKGFRLRILSHDPNVSAREMKAHDVEPATLDQILSQSDFVSLHCPLITQTHHLINAQTLRAMKPDAILINTARGAVVDEAALITALQNNWIAGAGLDVLETEPPPLDHPLLMMDQVVVTPHIAGHRDEALDLRWQHSLDAVIAVATGHWPRSVVNRTVEPRRHLTP
jgi:D-3-phosphoglycerate dehydrogenase / 2-oxoglutarate reductase